MKNFTTLSVAVVAAVMAVGFLAGALAVPVDQFQFDAEEALDAAPDAPQAPELPVVEGRAGRHARATCDLLSFSSKWVTPNHAACAAHCIAMFKGFKGGNCQGTVCHCRK